MIGYGFMGRIHSNAFKQVSQFFDLDDKPVLKAICARDAEKAAKFKHVCRDGWMFPNAVMQQQIWNDSYAVMIQVRENHGWKA